MKRWTLVNSDEYVKATTEGIVRSGRRVSDMRKELDKFILDLKAELLHGDQGGGCSNKKCKVCYPYGYRR